MSCTENLNGFSIGSMPLHSIFPNSECLATPFVGCHLRSLVVARVFPGRCDTGKGLDSGGTSNHWRVTAFVSVKRSGVSPFAGGTGWLALEPTGVPWHKRFAVVNLAIPEPLSAAPPRSPKAATGATPRGEHGGYLPVLRRLRACHSRWLCSG